MKSEVKQEVNQDVKSDVRRDPGFVTPGHPASVARTAIPRRLELVAALQPAPAAPRARGRRPAPVPVPRTVFIRMAVATALLAILGPAQARAADLIQTWDLFTGISTVVIEDSRGQVLATESWAGPLPAARTGDAEMLPLRLLARLRDQVSEGFSSEAGGVLSWLRRTMGDHADASAASLDGRWLAGIRDKETAHWCGTGLTSEGRCPSDCTSSDGPLNCKGCGCAGTKTFDIDLPTIDPRVP